MGFFSKLETDANRINKLGDSIGNLTSKFSAIKLPSVPVVVSLDFDKYKPFLIFAAVILAVVSLSLLFKNK